MILDFSQFRFFLRPGKTDLRKGINGLSLLIQNTMKHDPFSKSLFLFCNKRRKLLKIVYWDRNGFCLWQKKLDRDTFLTCCTVYSDSTIYVQPQLMYWT